MVTASARTLDWPALDAKGRELSGALTYERGIWGKAHDSAADYHWIALTPALEAPSRNVELELSLGAADVPRKHATFWRTIGDTSYAGVMYRSPSSDAAGRTGFLEKQVLEWKHPDVPAAIGALLLLPVVEKLDSSEWWSKRTEVQWDERDDHPIELAAGAPVPLTPAAIERAIADGIRALRSATNEDALSALYADVLAGRRATALADTADVLSASAVAALLLPLPRSLADQLSIVSWLPVSWLSDSAAESIRRCWDLVLAGDTTVPLQTVQEPSDEQRAQGREMASQIFHAEIPQPVSSEVDNRVQLTLWGPTQAGKTAFLAKLYLEADCEAEWEVYPTPNSYAFFNMMRARMETMQRFPVATAVGQLEEIDYILQHSGGTTFALHLEDRAGEESTKLPDVMPGKITLKERLGSAQGLILLFDATMDRGELSETVWNTLEQVYFTRGQIGGKDRRPIAVCLSKADIFIRSPADYSRALSDPDRFARDRVPDKVLEALQRRCAKYKLFPISAAGVRAQYGVIEPAVFLDEKLESRMCPGASPLNLMAPFSWLLREVTNVS